MSIPSILPPDLILSGSQKACWDAMINKTFFKLIAGGSLTELEKLAFLTRIYAKAGADCLDIAPVPEVIETVIQTLNRLPAPHPLVMISIPLDPDPHFRKIELLESDCIACGACLPICPTHAFSFSENQALTVHQPLCYGCGRCIPVCPSDALKLHPFWQPDVIAQVLSYPQVEAIELHTQHADPFTLNAFLADYGYLLQNKLIAFCFRPNQAKSSFWLESLKQLNTFAPDRILLQIDGSPMSGNDSPEASIPAIQSTLQVHMILSKDSDLQHIPITISGGINHHTATLLNNGYRQFISGIGMGTVARKAIWHLEHNEAEALQIASTLVSRFKTYNTSP